MKIPAIRSQMGIWVYYVSTLTFEQISQYVKPINDELHHSVVLSDMIQRSITDNYKDISDYLIGQDERFFNALILAVYDGNPMWNELRIEGEDGNDMYNMGLLTLNGEENIFPVDGQHRVEGIKDALKKKPELGSEKVAVIFVGHSKDTMGMQRTRRMFSTLNRYAKPVSMRDIVALDEDDIVAIVSRELMDNKKLLDKKILDSKTKAIPETATKAFTSIIQYYDCNKELLWLLIKDMDIKGIDGKKIRGRNKINVYIRHRPNDEMIAQFTELCDNYWSCLFTQCEDFIQNEDAEVGKYRNKEGGHIFFRPVSLYPFTKVMVKIKEKTGDEFGDILRGFPEEILWIQHRLWKRIIWNPDQKRMLRPSQILIENLLLYVYDKDLLSDKELDNIKSEWNSLWNVDKEEVLKQIDSIIAGKG